MGGLNTYAYTRNAPLWRTDRLGLAEIEMPDPDGFPINMTNANLESILTRGCINRYCTQKSRPTNTLNSLDQCTIVFGIFAKRDPGVTLRHSLERRRWLIFWEDVPTAVMKPLRVERIRVIQFSDAYEYVAKIRFQDSSRRGIALRWRVAIGNDVFDYSTS